MLKLKELIGNRYTIVIKQMREQTNTYKIKTNSIHFFKIVSVFIVYLLATGTYVIMLKSLDFLHKHHLA